LAAARGWRRRRLRVVDPAHRESAKGRGRAPDRTRTLRHGSQPHEVEKLRRPRRPARQARLASRPDRRAHAAPLLAPAGLMSTFDEQAIASLLIERGVPPARAKIAASRAVTFHDAKADSSIPSPLEPSKPAKGTRTRIRRESGRTPPCTSQARHRSEASVQREIVNALKLAGWSVWRIGQRDARKTQDPGVPDLYAMRACQFDPKANVYRRIAQVLAHPLAIWIEVKRPVGGVQSPEQREFQSLASLCGQRYILARSVDDIK